MAETVFVTGGAGYVGSHACKAFADAGWEVVTYDNLSRGWRDLVQFGPLIEGDILDTERLSAAIAESRPDAVAHFAAFAYVGESVARPEIYYRNNVQGTLSLLEAMRANAVGQMIFSSTCATYGMPEVMPVTEETPQAPLSPYGWSKLFVERMLKDYQIAHGLEFVALRYFNAAGADAGGKIGERHEPETHLIPLAIRAVMDPEFSLTVFGDDFDTRDGTCIRDYIHVTDLADAHLKALQHLRAARGSDCINLGTGTGTSVAEIIAAVERVTGEAPKHSIGPRRAGDPPVVVANNSKARDVLGWAPRHSDVDSILTTAFAWHQREGMWRG